MNEAHDEQANVGRVQRTKRNHKNKKWRLAMLAALLVWLGACALLGIMASEDINDAKGRIDRAQSVSLAQVLKGRQVAQLRYAETELRQGYDRLSSPILVPLKIVPILGRQITSARSLANASAEALDAGLDGLAVVRATIDQQGVNVDQRPAMFATLANEADKAYTRIQDFDLGPSKGLIGPLRDAHIEIAERLERTKRDLDRARTGLKQFGTLLSGNGRYLLLAANNAEMRAGSGMFLSAGELLINNGHLSITEMESVTDIERLDLGEIPVDPEVMSTWGWAQPGRDLRDIGVTPRFDVSAELAARMWERARGTTVDGVMAMDPVVLRALLKAVGPVKANNRLISANNVLDQLLHQQYVDFESEADNDRAGRQAALGAVAEGAFLRFDEFRWDATTLANGLAQAAQGRHLMLWSKAPAMQDAWVKAGIAGTLEKRSLMVSVLNYSGNKLDQFLDVQTEMSLTADTAGTQVKLDISISNKTPSGEPRYILGPYREGTIEPGTYGGVLTINVPGDATDVQIARPDSLAVDGPDGPTKVVGESFNLAVGATRKTTVSFHLPKGANVLRIEPAARVPAMSWKVGKKVFDSEATRWLNW